MRMAGIRRIEGGFLPPVARVDMEQQDAGPIAWLDCTPEPFELKNDRFAVAASGGAPAAHP